MLLLLGILKRKNKYYMNVVNTEKEYSFEGYQLINPYILNSCANVKAQRFLSSKQNPKEYLRAEFAIERIVVDDENLEKRINDYQIISLFYDEENKPRLYKSIDRAGNISMHDISEFEYTKSRSILGDDINKLPSFVERKTMNEAYDYLNSNNIDNQMPSVSVGLARHYLIGVKGFKEGFHTVTTINNGVDLTVHEYMLFNGSATIKLVEIIPKDRRILLTKQDNIASPYPKERTTSFLTGPIILFGSIRMLSRFCKLGANTEFVFYNDKVIKLAIPLNKDTLKVYDKYIKSKEIFYKWYLDFNTNLTEDIYKNILPNEILNLPNKFYRDMNNSLYRADKSAKLEKANSNVEKWMHTVSLFICWPIFTREFKSKFKPIFKHYHEIYTIILKSLVADIGPRDALTVMKWTKEQLKKEMKNILNSSDSIVDDNSCLFTFCQNNYDLPECLKVYSERSISTYGGLDKLKGDFENANQEKKNYIIKTLETIEKELQDSPEELAIKVDIGKSLRRIEKS